MERYGQCLMCTSVSLILGFTRRAYLLFLFLFCVRKERVCVNVSMKKKAIAEGS